MKNKFTAWHFVILLIVLITSISFYTIKKSIDNINSNIELVLDNSTTNEYDNCSYHCPICNSTEVYEETWLNYNTDEMITMYEDTCYCMNCESFIPELIKIKK